MKATEILPIVTHYIIRCLILLTQAIPIRPLRGDFDAVYTWNIFLHLDVPMTHSGKFLSDEEKPRCNGHGLWSLLRSLSPVYQRQIRILVDQCKTVQTVYLLLIATVDSHHLVDLLCKDKRLVGTFEDDLSTRQRCYHCLFANFRRLTGETSYSDTTVRNALRHVFDLEISTMLDAIAGCQGSDPQTIAQAIFGVSRLATSPDIQKKGEEISRKICTQNNIDPGSLKFDFPPGFLTIPECEFGEPEFATGPVKTDYTSAERKRAHRLYKWGKLDHPNVLPLGVMLKDKSPSELAAVSELMELGHAIEVARVRKDTNWSEFFAERLREMEDAEEQERNHCGGSQG